LNKISSFYPKLTVELLNLQALNKLLVKLTQLDYCKGNYKSRKLGITEMTILRRIFYRRQKIFVQKKKLS